METFFEAAGRQIPVLAEHVAEQLRSVVTNRLTAEVARMQRAAGEADALRQTALDEAANLERVNAAKRAEAVALGEAIADKRRQADELDAEIGEKTVRSRELHDQLDRLTAAINAAHLVAHPVA